MTRFKAVLLIVGCAVVLSCFSPLNASAKGCLNSSCHQEFISLRYMHGPVAAELAGGTGCVMCHMPAGPACTPAKAGAFTLKRKKICLTCHDKGTGTQHSQSHIEEKCLLCHAPHGSQSSPQMLRQNR